MKQLTEYLKTLPSNEREAFARKCGTSEGYMRKCVSEGRVLNPFVCNAIERETGGLITRQQLRPDDYWLAWPDLPAPQIPANGCDVEKELE